MHTSGLPTNFYLLFISNIKYSYLFLHSPLWFQNLYTVLNSSKLRSFLFCKSFLKRTSFFCLSLVSQNIQLGIPSSVTLALCPSSVDKANFKPIRTTHNIIELNTWFSYCTLYSTAHFNRVKFVFLITLRFSIWLYRNQANVWRYLLHCFT